MIISYGAKHYHTMCTVIHCLWLQCLWETISVHRFLPPLLVGHACSQWSQKVKPMRHRPFSFSNVPPVVICDNAKDLIPGEFNRKLKEASCHLKQMEPFTPWSHAAKRELYKLKKGSGRKLIKSGAPKRLWDDDLELDSYIRSNTAHCIYKLNGEVPETIMFG